MKTITHLTPNTTKQELFNYVASFLLKQGRRSVGACSSGCVYRGPNGLMCAAGCVIPDEFYDPSMEGEDIHTVFKERRKTKGQERFWIALEKHHALLSDLQEVHDIQTRGDRKAVSRAWLRDLCGVAINHGLVFDGALAQLAERSD